MLRRLSYNMTIRHNRIFMLCHVVVANLLFSLVIVAYCFLLRVVFCFVLFLNVFDGADWCVCHPYFS